METLNWASGRRTRIRAVAIVLLVLLGANGCARYVATPLAQTLATGERVQIQFRNLRDVRMGEVTANDVRTLGGEVVDYRGDTLVVAAFTAVAANGYETLGPGASVAIHRDEIATVGVSRLSVARTAGLTAIFVGLTVLLATALKNVGGGGGDETPPGGEQ